MSEMQHRDGACLKMDRLSSTVPKKLAATQGRLNGPLLGFDPRALPIADVLMVHAAAHNPRSQDPREIAQHDLFLIRLKHQS
jgi:hypothetical protein